MESGSDGKTHNDPPTGEVTSKQALQSRAYQIEMFEQSMLGNVIIACQTAYRSGIGKISSKGLRHNQSLLDSLTSAGKRVWFCAPNVVLAQQQHKFLSSQLPSYQTRLITGLDNVQFWSKQSIWDKVLEGVEIVVSTPQVLLDALAHGFVRLQALCLLVFDEAHHCVSNAPMAAIMRRFYHPAKEATFDVPYVLGMTASPITNKPASLRELEANMNAVCKAPTIQIEEYRQHVYLPALERLTFRSTPSDQSAALKSLRDICRRLQMADDPAVAWLKGRSDINSQQKLAKIVNARRTPVMKQMDTFLGHATHICNELGPWSADLYIKTCVGKLQESTTLQESLGFISTLATQEQQYMHTRLQPLREATPYVSDEALDPNRIAPKTMAVLNYLLKEYRPGITAIVFVKRRSVAYSLAQLIQAFFPDEQYKVFSFVGSAGLANRTLVDLADMEVQKEAFADFRAGERNICVATQVMEEGVDVQAINLVIRFDEPETFRSFIQSRGRARHIDSKFVMVHAREDTDSVEKLVRWKELEETLRARYTDVMKYIREVEAQENQWEDGNEFYRIATSGALLSYDNARQHLEYFYQSLPQAQVLESAQVPIVLSKEQPGKISARVVLPSSMPPSLQATNSLRTWRTEKRAKQDAAFQTLKALHTAGLIDDNLMPPPRARQQEFEVESRDSMYKVGGPIDPWAFPTADTTNSPRLQCHRIEVSGDNFALPAMKLLMPLRLDSEMTFQLHLATTGAATVHLTPMDDVELPPPGLAEKITTYLFMAALGRRLKAVSQDDPLPFLLLPDRVEGDYQTWFDSVQVVTPLADMTFNQSLTQQCYLLRHRNQEILYKWSPTYEDQDVKSYLPQESVVAERLSKQLSFLTRGDLTSPRDVRPIAVSDCSVQSLSPAYADFMLLVPSIQFMLGVRLRGQLATQHGPLRSVGFGNSNLVAKALISSDALASYNYESLEFMGDTLLKYYGNVQVYFDYPLFAVGALTSKSSSFVNNARLQRATKECGLDQYITIERFSGDKWTLKVAGDGVVRRTVPSKTLADVAEALIATAYLDLKNNGSPDELPMRLLSLLIPDVPWKSPDAHVSEFHLKTPPNQLQIAKLADVEEMIGHTFKHKSLLAEALTRTSLRIGLQSYDRLEFLGDAVLDRIVSVALYTSERRLGPDNMKDCKAALVNRWTLAFFVMNATHTIVTSNAETAANGRTTFVQGSRTVRLIDHMKTSGDRAELRQRERAEQTFLQAHGEISEAFDNQKTFPWTSVVSIDTSKPYSDVFESILGAVFVDSGASLPACEQVLDKLGLMKMLRRITTEFDYDVRQPVDMLLELHPELDKRFSESGKAGDASKKWTCEILKGDEVVGRFQSSTSVKHAEAVAIGMALEAMRSRKRKCSEVDMD